jgi:phosphatidylserine/phosphatidylglycerophosphate/cardiolipin synthase-like enzyme
MPDPTQKKPALLIPVRADAGDLAAAGDAIPLAYADDGITTNEVLVTARHGKIRATFTNGILAAQWLTHALEGLGQQPTPAVLISHILNQADPLRRYLTGDVLGMLKELLERAKEGDGAPAAKKPSPSTYDRGNIHVVRATAMMKGDLIGDFERELLTAGKAIIHDKIVVVDPLSANGFVAMGSHNLGYKASYENDENLLIVRHNKTLVQAYAIHVMDVYEHYRFRAIEAERAATKPVTPADKHPDWDGFLSTDDHWLTRAMDPANSGLSEYFAH